MPTVEHDGASIYWKKTGSGPPLILCAGLGGVGSYWDTNVDALSRHFSLKIMDQRGTGKSSRVPVKSIEQMSKDVIALMDAENIEQAHFLGHSTGSAIGLATALDYPGRLKSVVIYASTTRGDHYRRKIFNLRKTVLEKAGEQAYAQLTSLLLYPPYWHNEHHEELQEAENRSAGSLGDAAIQGSRFDAILNFDRRNEMNEISIPTLIMCANDDILTPRYFSEEFARLIPGCRTIWFDKGGHAMSRTRSDEFNRVVIDFLLESEAAGTNPP